MKVDEFVRLATRLANFHWTRYWLMWGGTGEILAIQCVDHAGRPKEIKELADLGFEVATGPHLNGQFVYLIRRTT